MLNNDLIDLGMVKAFLPGEADFTKINAGGNLYISFVKHNSFVEVNETGTEAAAVTVVAISETSIGPGQGTYYIPFIVNKPFIFAIRETTTNTVIFLGKILNPKTA
jgi:serine protease inhibitor